MSRLRSAHWLPLFDDLAAPRVVAQVAAGLPGKVTPMRRAAGLDGFFPVNLEHPDQLAEIVATITELRGGQSGPFDIAVSLPADADPFPYAAAGATWWLPEFDPGVPLDTVWGVLRDGPASPGGE